MFLECQQVGGHVHPPNILTETTYYYCLLSHAPPPWAHTLKQCELKWRSSMLALYAHNNVKAHFPSQAHAHTQ